MSNNDMDFVVMSRRGLMSTEETGAISLALAQALQRLETSANFDVTSQYELQFKRQAFVIRVTNADDSARRLFKVVANCVDRLGLEALKNAEIY